MKIPNCDKVGLSVFNKSKILQDVLKFRYRHGTATFWLRNKDMTAVAESILYAMDRNNESSLPQGMEVIRQTHSRIILRINSPNFAGQSIIAKVFLIPCLRHRLKYHIKKYDRFAFAEAANLIIAAERGLSVPKVYGYGCIYDSFGLIKRSIVFLEDLANRIHIGKLLELNRQDQNKCADILSRVIPVFVELYKVNCSHIDVNSRSILLNGEDLKQKVFLLDFEYAGFYDRQSLEIFMFEAAYFAKCCTDWLTKETIDEWVAKLLDAVEIRDALGRDKAMERFNYYYFGKRLSRRERIKIH